jgi:hypothetical protein
MIRPALDRARAFFQGDFLYRINLAAGDGGSLETWRRWPLSAMRSAHDGGRPGRRADARRAGQGGPVGSCTSARGKIVFITLLKIAAAYIYGNLAHLSFRRAGWRATAAGADAGFARAGGAGGPVHPARAGRLGER